MDPQLAEELRIIHALVKQNHEMLRAIRRDAWFHTMVHLIFWLAIVIGTWYAYATYLAPYVGNLPTPAELQQLISQYKVK